MFAESYNWIIANQLRDKIHLQNQAIIELVSTVMVYQISRTESGGN
jgi:hypothetical protein